MRLNSALASFLFVSMVLADYHPEKHQPRFRNVPWAGAFLLEGNEACLFRTGGYTSTVGTFPVPLAWDGNNTGVWVAVGIGGIAGVCNDSNIMFLAGIHVSFTDNVVSYAGGAGWGDQFEWALNFDIATGDFIRANVTMYSATTGFASLENLSTDRAWSESFSVDESVVCQRSAQWAVSALENHPSGDKPVPKFSTVTFVNAVAKTASGASAMPGGANIRNIKYHNTTLTTSMANENVVVVASEM